MKKSIAIFSVMLLMPLIHWAQRTTVKGFGHLDLVWENQGDHLDAYMAIGEHALFVNSQLNERISFLGEAVVKPSGSGFAASLERAWLKYSFGKGFNVILGKMHTPVNYWNDVYNHARVFFPTIDRPSAFSSYIPIHTLGMRFQGQNIGKMKFGYDVVLGNGMESTDTYANGVNPSFTAAVHCKPKDGIRIGASYHYEHLSDATSHGSHAGHSTSPGMMPGMVMYDGALDFHLVSASAAYFTEKFEVLLETSYNLTQTDTLGNAHNFSTFLYLGKPVNEVHVPFVVFDFLKIDDEDLHTYPFNKLKAGIGYRYEFTPVCNIKLMAEYYTGLSNFTNPAASKYEFKTQFSYGF